MVLICLAKTGKDDESIVEYKGKPLPGQVCFQLPSYDVGGNGSLPTEDDWQKGLKIALLSQSTTADSDAVGTMMVRVEDEEEEGPRGCAASSFRSSTRGGVEGGSSSLTTTTGGMPYVGCHNGFHDGVLSPQGGIFILQATPIRASIETRVHLVWTRVRRISLRRRNREARRRR